MGDSPKNTCDMMIYDEEADKHVRVQWREALKATCAKEILNDFAAGLVGAGKDDKVDRPEQYDDPVQFPRMPRVSTGNGQTISLAEWYNRAIEWAKYNEGNAVTISEDLKKIQDTRIVVARPFIEHLMHNVIMAVAGRETGATLFGPAE